MRAPPAGRRRARSPTSGGSRRDRTERRRSLRRSPPRCPRRPVHRPHQAILEAARGEEGVENRPQRVGHVGGRFPFVPVEPEHRVSCDQFVRRRPQAREGRAEEASLDDHSHRDARGVGQRVVVGDLRLLDREARQPFLVPQRVQRHRGHPHGGAVPGVPFVRRSREASRLDVLHDPAPAGGADVDGPPAKANGRTGRRSPRDPLPARRRSPVRRKASIAVSIVTCPGARRAIRRR